MTTRIYGKRCVGWGLSPTLSHGCGPTQGPERPGWRPRAERQAVWLLLSTRHVSSVHEPSASIIFETEERNRNNDKYHNSNNNSNYRNGSNINNYNHHLRETCLLPPALPGAHVDSPGVTTGRGGPSGCSEGKQRESELAPNPPNVFFKSSP